MYFVSHYRRKQHTCVVKVELSPETYGPEQVPTLANFDIKVKEEPHVSDYGNDRIDNTIFPSSFVEVRLEANDEHSSEAPSPHKKHKSNVKPSVPHRKPFECKACGVFFVTQYKRNKHLCLKAVQSSSEKLDASLPDSLNEGRRKRRTRKPSSKKQLSALVECNLCDEVFENDTEFQKHIKDFDHSAVGRYVCYLCHDIR